MLLFSTNDLSGFVVQGKDQSIGKIGGFLFHPKTWKLDYLTVSRGFWPFNKELYLPVEVLGIPDNLQEAIQVELTHEEVEKLQRDIHSNIQMRLYSEHPIHYWRIGKYPKSIPWLDPFAISTVFKQRKEDGGISLDDTDNAKNLRHSEDVKGYRVDAKDETMGNVVDLVIDADHWVIRYVIIEELDEKIMLPPAWVKNINPIAETVNLNLNRQMVLESPYVIG